MVRRAPEAADEHPVRSTSWTNHHHRALPERVLPLNNQPSEPAVTCYFPRNDSSKGGVMKSLRSTATLTVALASAVVVAVAAPAAADNDCSADGIAVPITTTWHASIKDVWTGCQAFGIQIRTYAGGSSYNYAYRKWDYPATNVPYSTAKISGSSPSWRACSYLGIYPTNNCTNLQYEWRWSSWYPNTSWKRFD
jgi:hypothetical protein